MKRHLAFIAVVLGLFVLTAPSHAQTTYPVGSSVGCVPAGFSYSHPVYPYGAYPGYAPYSFGGVANYPGYAYDAPVATGPAPKFRANAYSTWELYQYNLPANPAQYIPSITPKTMPAYLPPKNYNP